MSARGFVRRGVKTYIASRDADRSPAAAADLSEAGECIGIAADLAADDGPERLAMRKAEREERLDILVNNAGAYDHAGIDALTPDSWNFVMNVNVRAPFFLVQKLPPLLRAAATSKAPARIIKYRLHRRAAYSGLGSLSLWRVQGGAASSHPRAGQTAGTESHPGQCHSPRALPSRLTDTDSDAVQRSIEAHIPLKRAGQAEDVEGLTVFLASRAGAYVNGCTIPLDGGYLAAL